jgi:cytochrome c-type biogenesis protein
MAALWERAGTASDWLRRHRRALQNVGGLLLVAVGLLMLTGVWEDVIVWIQVRLVNGFQVAI